MESSDRRTLNLFRAGILLGAFLLFVVQPMYAKRLLPSLGGSPAVWNTVMVFFQASLLAGYAYAHSMAGWKRRRAAAVVHLVLLAVAAALPIMPPPGSAPSGNLASIGWLLGTLAFGVGPAFLLVSATSPLIQAWFARSDHPQRESPYFLYSASNLGSFAALLAYPIVIEPWLPVAYQIGAWRIGVVTLWILLCVCSRAVRSSDREASPIEADRTSREPADPLTWGRRCQWLVCATAASSLLLGVTQSLTTDLAPVPLLWVIPLGIYLISFVMAFAANPVVSRSAWDRWLPAVMVLLVASLILQGTWQPIVVHLAAFTCAVMVCHYAVAETRPSASRLTEFYLWVSLGGVIGGVFNALVAPLLFSVIVEYGLAVMLCALAARPLASENDSGASLSQTLLRDRGTLIVMGATIVAVGILAATSVFRGTPTMAIAVVVAAPIMVVGWLLGMSRAVVLVAGVLLIINQYEPPLAGRTRHVERSFFGVHRVMSADVLSETRLIHGSTIHGIQSSRFPDQPLAYYARTGPLGDLFGSLSPSQTQRIGVVGLGAGAIAAYRSTDRGERSMTFFEIDPSVIRIATDRQYFTYLSDAGLSDEDLILGDGRAQLSQWSGDRFDGLVLDAFSSDAIPMHLLTREALAVYRRQLADDGWIAFHISNQHLDLGPVLGGLAADAGWVAYRKTSSPTTDERDQGIAVASYVVLAPRASTVQSLVDDGTWTSIESDDAPVWTDDFSNLLDVLDW